MAPALVLFDIDGTLVRKAGPHHGRSLAHAVRVVTGLETSIDGIPVQGMLDADIVAEMLRRAGARDGAIRSSIPKIAALAGEHYESTCPGLARKVIPGVRGALRRLDRAGVLMGLVTGNMTRIGWHKMQQAGLADYFRFGAFSGMGATRAALAGIALRQARRECWIGRGAPVSLVGDHPNDVLAARANGMRSIAVATGVVPRIELERLEPDHLLVDMRELTVELVL
jgi:phosphoglycolate phosphatase-like HAD superfamily hydrolase